MLTLFERTKELVVDCCDRCAQVCDAGCRAAAPRERVRMRALRHGLRV